MFLSKNIAHIEKVTFTKHLSIMLKSGIPIAEALDLLREQTGNPHFKNVLKEVLTDINNGKSLTDAISKHKNVFDNLYINMIRTGELSGNLENNLDYLAVKLHKDYLFKQKVTSASTYPLLIVLTAFIAGIYISLFVLPKLTTLFESMDMDLPMTTKILIWFSDLMRDHGIVIFSSIIIALIIFRLLLNIKSIRYVWHKFLLSVPVVGTFIVNIQMTSACRNMGIMIKSGIPIVESIKASGSTLSNLIFKEYFDKIHIAVLSGSTIGAEIKKSHFEKFPKIASKMIEVGEKTGKLDETLLYMGDFFDNEVDTTTKNLSTVLEPILLLSIGLFVAFLALAIISPIYQFTGSIEK